jgi:hypothetical protein
VSAIIDSSAIHAMFERPQQNGAYEGQVLQYLRAVGTLRSILLLAFAPKVAGTYFRQAAIYAIDGQLVRTVHAQGGRDGTLYLPNILSCYLDKDAPETVTHVHMQALAANRHFMEALGIKPVIMIRNLPDMLASFWDMLEADPAARAEGLNCLIPDHFAELSRAEKANFMTDIIAPWYVSYFATWKEVEDTKSNMVCVLRYPDFCDRPAETLHAALSHAGFPVSLGKCEASLARVWAERASYRYNKGSQGRGRGYFSPAHFEKLSGMLAYYPKLKSWMSDLMGDNLRETDVRERA